MVLDGYRLALVGLVMIQKPVPPLFKFGDIPVDDVLSVCLLYIINYMHLDGGIGLTQNRVQQSGNILAAIICWGQYAYQI